MTHREQMRAHRSRVEEWLTAYLQGLTPYGDLTEAMAYSLLAGGKRVRPVLTLAACRFCGGDPEKALPLAGAVEMIHTYSLIHDDLPAMDDDDYRRGRLTNHKVFGEATAILAGDGLLTAAFGVAAAAQLPPQQVVRAMQVLAQAMGPEGMVAGQILDMAGEGKPLSLEEVKATEALKTGAAIVAAVRLGCVAAGGSPQQEAALIAYAENLGLAFQVQDDLLDVTGDASLLGKEPGSDQASGKTTFVQLLGAVGCEALVRELTDRAILALKPYEESGFLCWLAEMLVGRQT